MSREVQHLHRLVQEGKLRPDYALDLSRYVKLLKDMQEAEEKEKAKLAAKAKADAQSPEDILNALTTGTTKEPKG